MQLLDQFKLLVQRKRAPDFVCSLPAEFCLRLFVEFLEPSDVCHLSGVSHAWRRLTADNRIWWPLCAAIAWQLDSEEEAADNSLAPLSFDASQMSKAAKKLNWRATFLDHMKSQRVHIAKVNAAARARKFVLRSDVDSSLVATLWHPRAPSHTLLFLGTIAPSREAVRRDWREAPARGTPEHKAEARAAYQIATNKKPVTKFHSHAARDEKLNSMLLRDDD